MLSCPFSAFLCGILTVVNNGSGHAFALKRIGVSRVIGQRRLDTAEVSNYPTVALRRSGPPGSLAKHYAETRALSALKLLGEA